MSDKNEKPVAASEKVSAPAAPMDGAIAALNEGKAGSELTAARGLVSKVFGGNRPWPQLPIALRQAARNDARRVIDDAKGDFIALLIKAGYEKPVAAQLCRDLGKVG